MIVLVGLVAAAAWLAGVVVGVLVAEVVRPPDPPAPDDPRSDEARWLSGVLQRASARMDREGVSPPAASIQQPIAFIAPSRVRRGE